MPMARDLLPLTFNSIIVRAKAQVAARSKANAATHGAK